MDGTLLAGSASLQIAKTLGRSQDLIALEARFAAGEVDTRQFAAALRRLWHDLSPAVVTAAFEASPWLTGIRGVNADIRRRDELSAVITMSPDFFARKLLRWGFDVVVASRFPSLPFRDPLDPEAILRPADKVSIAEALLARHGLPESRCVAYGDSMSDAPLFRRLTATVAVNADPHLAGLAAVNYRGTDLSEAYALGRSLVDLPGR